MFVAQIDIRALNNLLTDNNGWRSTGQGETGEVLLTGEDRLMRSQSRFMIESPDKFLAQAQANGLPASTANQIRTLGTTILYMPNRSEAVEQSFRNKTGPGPISGLSWCGGDLGLRPGGSGRPAVGDRLQTGPGRSARSGDPAEARSAGGRRRRNGRTHFPGASLRRTCSRARCGVLSPA